MKFQGVKGARDWYPEDRATFNWMANAFRQMAVKYGFLEVESPAIESLALLCEKEGEEIRQQIFTLEKKGSEQLGLRFDLTIPMARMFITKQKELPKPVKWFNIGRMWRYEAPQKGRLREFYQFGVEIFGSDKPETDAQIISLIIDSFQALGLTSKDFYVKLNNRNLLQGILESFGIGNIADVMTVIDKMAKISEEEFVAELEKLKLSQTQIKKLDQTLKLRDLKQLRDLNELAQQGKGELLNVLDLLEDRQEFIQVDLTVARGLAYYTGTVFEVYDRAGKYRALAGGGRYDQMVKLFGGEPCSATGFGVGFATLGLLLDEKMLIPEPDVRVDYYVAPIKDDPKVIMLANTIAAKLRKDFRVDVDLMRRSMSKQFEYATKIKAKNVIIVGDNELKTGVVTVKNLETGKEEKKKIALL
ncbi:histidine--tRNA ligase [Candidatus Woesearchaeota archaeon]|nr:histidine--tRNA ligase [Candidatus Woesearchaeota archaeon]